MKIEIEIPDLEEIYFSGHGYDETITGYNIKKAISELAIEKYVDNLYNDYKCDNMYSSIKNEAENVVKEHSQEIIDKVIEKVSKEIMAKKAIVNEMPKKSEIVNISKEWEQYFMELSDKAIAKRFK